MNSQKQIEEELAEVAHEPRSFDVSATEVETDGLFSTLDGMASEYDVAGFKCVSCGLAHGHDTNKHRASDTFELGAAEAAAKMDYNPNCHCGVQELSRHGGDFGVDEGEASRIASGAPIPDEEAVAMNERYS